jgi:hypothetical protein
MKDERWNNYPIPVDFGFLDLCWDGQGQKDEGGWIGRDMSD